VQNVRLPSHRRTLSPRSFTDWATLATVCLGLLTSLAPISPAQGQVIGAPGSIPGSVPQIVPQQSPSTPQLPTDPNARIEDLVAPLPAFQPLGGQPAGGAPRSALPAGLGATASSFSAAPNMMGDFFGGGLSRASIRETSSFSNVLSGTVLSGGDGDAAAILAFEVGADTLPNDLFTTGIGIDASGDANPDTFQILEPIPPSDALTAPGPGFTFDGGTAVFVEPDPTATEAQSGIFVDGDQWLVRYSFSQLLAGEGAGIVAIPGPGVSVRRVKISENFSPEVRNRFFTNYSFFNDSFGGLGDISRIIFGQEVLIVDDLISVEFRVPTAATFGSTQSIEGPEQRDFELGNVTLIAKGVLLRSQKMIWSGGLGISLPVADDSVLTRDGGTILRVENNSIHLLPFTGFLFRKNRETTLQASMQLDIAANGDPVFGNLDGGVLPQLGVFTDSTLLYLDLGINHLLFQGHGRDRIRSIHGNAELHYTGTLNGSDSINNNGFNYTNLAENFNILNATTGFHIALDNNLVVTPAISVPLRNGLDQQFDYEAVLQLNYYP